MSVQAATPGPLTVRTVSIDPPDDLLAAMPEQGISWVRRGEGLIAWGEVARFDSTGTARIDEADAWWRRVTRHALVRDDVQRPGSGLLAFGSFAFADGSDAGGTLIIPRYVVGVRGDDAWLTVISDDGHTHMPSFAEATAAAVAPPALPKVDIDQGDREAWDQAVTAAVHRISAGELDKVVLARAVPARASAPIDVRAVLPTLAADYPSCWTFHVDGLVGATPELLARLGPPLQRRRHRGVARRHHHA